MKILCTQFYLYFFVSLLSLACGGDDGGGDDGDTSAPTGGSIAIEAVTDQSIIILVENATDNSTPAEELQYSIYYSEAELSEDIKTLQNDAIPSGGWAVNTASRSIVGLPVATAYNLTALVKDASSNMAKLNVLTATTGAPPTLPAVPTISSVVLADDVTLSWTKATSDVVSDTSLLYKVYTSSQNNIYSVETAIANGTAAAEWKANISSLALNSIGPSKRVYFNVLVKDSNDSAVSYLSSSFDTDSEIHISYFDNTNRDVKYVNKLSTTWSTPVVVSGSDTANYASNNSLALNSAGQAHICYYDENSNNDDLRLSSFDGTQFNIETVANIGDTGRYCSIDFNDADEFYITAYDASARNPIFFFKFQGIWSEQAIDSIADNDGYYTDFVIDDQGKVHIAYYNTTTQDLIYASNKTGLWVAEQVDTTGNVGYNPSIVVHPDQTVSIAYRDATSVDLKVADNNSGAWVVQTIDSVGNTGYTPSIKLGPDGLLNIAYFSSTGTQLRYIKETTKGVWGSYEIVDGYIQSAGNSGVSLAVDNLSRVHISYFNDNTDDLVYAYRKSPSSVWEITEVDQDSNDVGRGSSIQVR